MSKAKASQFKPLPPYLLIKLVKAQIPTDIILTETQKKELLSKRHGIVIAVSDERDEFRVNDKCFFEDYAGQEVEFEDDGEFIILKRDEIRAYLRPQQTTSTILQAN